MSKKIRDWVLASVFIGIGLALLIGYVQLTNPVHFAHLKVGNHMMVPAQQGWSAKYYICDEHSPPNLHFCRHADWARMKDSSEYEVLENWKHEIVAVLN